MLKRDDFVTIAVKHEQRDFDLFDGRPHIVAGPEKRSDRQVWEQDTRHLGDRDEWAFQDQSLTFETGRHFGSDGRTQRAPEKNQLLGAVAAEFFSHQLERRFTVQIRSFFGGESLAATVTSIVEDKDIHWNPVVKPLDVLNPVADVTGISMKPNQGGACLRVRDEPTVQPYAIAGGEKDVFKFKAGLLRRRVDRRIRVENHPIFNAACRKNTNAHQE